MVVAHKQNLAHKPARKASQLSAFADALGSPDGVDPIPPSQYLFFLDIDQPVLQRVIAWLRSKTIRYRGRPDGSDGRSAFAVNDRGKVLTLADMARELGLDKSNATRAWKAAAELGLVRREGKRLYLTGNAPRPKLGKPEEKSCQYRQLPASLVRTIKSWPEERQAEFNAVWEPALKLSEDLQANAIAEARKVSTSIHDSILSHFGLPKKRMPAEAPRPAIVVPEQLNLFVKVAPFWSVQTTISAARTDNKTEVCTDPPYKESEERQSSTTPAARSSVAAPRPAATMKNMEGETSKATSSAFSTARTAPIDDGAPYVAEVQAAMKAAGNPFHAGDVATAHKWDQWGISATVARRAIFLGTLRQFIAAKNSDAEPGVHSLRYFDRILAEVQETEVSEGYWDHVENRLARERSKPSGVSVADAQ